MDVRSRLLHIWEFMYWRISSENVCLDVNAVVAELGAGHCRLLPHGLGEMDVSPHSAS